MREAADSERSRGWGRSSAWLTTLWLLAAAAAQFLGCATPEERHRVLTFFFDDVPPLYAEEAEPTPEEMARLLAETHPDELPPGWIVSVHDPVESKDCDDCHESRYSNRLVEPTQEICWECHDEEDFEGEYLHGPVESGYCVGCHQPHRSPFPYLLVRSETDLCAQCHDQDTYPDLDAHTLDKGADCQRCHDPHAADREYMLRDDEEAS